MIIIENQTKVPPNNVESSAEFHISKTIDPLAVVELSNDDYDIDKHVINQKVYKCDSCGEEFQYYHQMSKHILKVHDSGAQKINKCEFCGKTYSSYSWLNAHIYKVHEGHTSNNNCDICNQKFPGAVALKRHTINFHEGKHSCSLCTYSFKNSVLLDAHRFKIHNNGHQALKNSAILILNISTSCDENSDLKKYKEHSCQHCGKIFSSKYYLREHVSKLHQSADGKNLKIEKSYRCNFCKKAYEKNYQLQKHIRIDHEGKKDYKCETCAEAFSYKEKLERHIETIHDGVLDQICDICDKSFYQEKDLKLHINRVHEKPICKTCGKKFKISSVLKRHVESVHEGRKDYICDSCGKHLASKGSLQGHIYSVHENHPKEHKCDSCSKLFSHKSHLQTHIKFIHEGRKEHKCELCERSFHYKKDVVNHIHSVHNKRKDHKCDFCGKLLSYASSVRKHIARWHNDGKTGMKCEICSKMFSELSRLNRHIRVFHKINKCKLCHKNFDYLKDLKKHLKSSHYKCDMCHISFPNSAFLKNHIFTDHDNRLEIKCNSCEKTFSTQKFLEKHIKSYHKREESACDLNAQQFTTDEKLPNHVLLQTIHKGYYKCISCKKTFSTQKFLEKHIDSFHQKEKTASQTIYKISSNKCEYCDKTFHDANDLKKHIYQNHHDEIQKDEYEKDYKCNICNKNLKSKVCINRHMKVVHGGSELKDYYKCELCSKKFISSRALQKHFASHHRCCGKTFSIFELIKHAKNVHEDKEYQDIQRASTVIMPLEKELNNATEKKVINKCDICSINLTGALDVHIKIVHAVGKDQKCHLCGKKFSLSSHLKEHISTEHQCCGKSFKTADLIAHISKVHHEDESQDHQQILRRTKGKSKGIQEEGAKLGVEKISTKKINTTRKPNPICLFTLADIESEFSDD